MKAALVTIKREFGPLNRGALTISAPFAFSQMYLKGPYLVRKSKFCMPTRASNPYIKAHIMTFACHYSKLMWGEVIEDKSAESVLLAITRLACSFCTPVQVQVDPDAAEIEVLREAVFVTSMRESLYKHHGIRYEVTPTGCHTRYGLVENRQKGFSRLLGSLDLRKTDISLMSLQTLTYQISSLCNSTPLGLMTIETPFSSMKFITPNHFLNHVNYKRSLVGPILLPTSTYSHYYYSTTILPQLLPRPKWYADHEKETLQPDDVVFFNFREQNAFAPQWRLGKIQDTNWSVDKKVWVVTVMYAKDSPRELEDGVTRINDED